MQVEKHEQEEVRKTESFQSELKPVKRNRKSAEKLGLKHSKSMNSIKVNLSKGAISEVKLKKSPSVSRITK
jgi:hypothetical protein